MSLRLQAITFDADQPAEVAAFWSGLLDRPAVPEPGGVLLPGDDTQVGLRFVAAETGRTSRERLHLHLTSSSAADQQSTVDQDRVSEEVDRLVALGTTRLLDLEDGVELADPDGAEFQVRQG